MKKTSKVIRPTYKERDNIVFIGVSSDRLSMSFDNTEQKRERRTFTEKLATLDALIIDGNKIASEISPQKTFFTYGYENFPKRDRLLHFEDGLNYYDFVENHGIRAADFILFKYWSLMADMPNAVIRLILDPNCLTQFFRLYGTPEDITHNNISNFLMRSIENISDQTSADIQSAITAFSTYYRSIIFQEVYRPKIQDLMNRYPKLGVLTFAKAIPKLEEVLDGVDLVPQYWYEYAMTLPFDVRSAISAIQETTKNELQ